MIFFKFTVSTLIFGRGQTSPPVTIWGQLFESRFIVLLDKGFSFLKELWCVAGEWKRMFGLSTELITKGKLTTVKTFSYQLKR